MKIFFLKKTPFTRLAFFLVCDAVLISAAVIIAFLLRFDGLIPAQYFESGLLVKSILGTIFFCVLLFYFFKLYSFSWSYVSAREMYSLFEANTLAFLFLGMAIFFSQDFRFFTGFPRSTIFISYFLVFIFCGALRFSKRIYFLSFKNFGSGMKRKTLIVGAGDAGEQIVRSIQSSKVSPYFPVGIVDDNPMKKGVIIHGLKVLGKISDMEKIAKEKGIEQVIVALPSAGNKIIRDAISYAKKAGIKNIKIVPPLADIIKGQVSFKNLQNVDAVDLLGRSEVVLNTKQIENSINKKIVLVTGAAGSIGSELSRQVAGFKPSLLLLLDQDETGIFNIGNELKENFPGIGTVSIIADVTDKIKIEGIFKKYKPEIVFHAAAYKHVPLMEENQDEAVKNNIFGTKNVAEVSLEFSVEKFIFISTDKAVNSTSVMGATKRIGEMICQKLNQEGGTKFISVRFGNVLDSRGSVIPIFREQIRKGGPVQVTHPEMKRYFMLISEACLLVMQAGAMGEGGEVFVLDMGQPVKILDLAKDIIKLSGFEPDKDIAIVFTNPRPGEKLFEEILTAEEGVDATKNQRVFKAKQSFDKDKLNLCIADLKRAMGNGEKQEIVNILKNFSVIK